MSEEILLRGARLFDPGQALDEVADVLVAGGTIRQVGGSITADGAIVIDLKGAHLLPGFVDMHVHLRQPGQDAKETLATALRAAERGGFTAIGAMANTNPPIDSARAARAVEEAAAALSPIRVHQFGSVTLALRGEALAPFEAYAGAGILAASDDGAPVSHAGVMARALAHARAAGLLVIEHAEDPELAGDGVASLSESALRLGLPTQDPLSEAVMVARDVLLAGRAGARLHIAHASTADTCDVVAFGKGRGVRVSAEVTPHHLLLTDEAIRRGTNAKMNPPLRSEADRRAMVAALEAGVLDAVATDHAPHTADEKASGWLEAPFGISGLETAFSLLYTDLVRPGNLSLPRLVTALSSAPAAILGIERRAVTPGMAANLTAVDLAATWTVEPETLATKGRNTPFAGRQLTGRVIGIVADGKWVAA